jgi:hypothetical protein
MLTQVVNATFRILLFRAGPQDFPYVPGLTRLLVPTAIVTNFLLASISLSPALAIVSSAVAIFGLSVSTRAVLRLRNLDNRYEQTFHSLLATSSVMTLALAIPTAQLMPEILQVAQNPELLQKPDATLQLPAGAVLLFDLLVVWNFAVTAHIYRHAAGMRLPLAVLVVLLISLSLLMFVGFATSAIGALFGLQAPVAGG